MCADTFNSTPSLCDYRPRDRANKMEEEFVIRRLPGEQLVQEEKTEVGDVRSGCGLACVSSKLAVDDIYR